MTHRSRFALWTLTTLATVVGVLLLSGCGAPTGLGAGELAERVSPQPRPESLWPAWSSLAPDQPGADAAARQAPPKPLAAAPRVPRGGLAAMDVRTIVRADPRLKTICQRGLITGPGKAGVRPPLLRDLTGDGERELIVAADLESGRTALVVYTARDGKVVPVLYTAGRHLSAEVVGTDLVVRTAVGDGAEQAVRYHWNGRRLAARGDDKKFPKSVDKRVTRP
ncbi:hypothetical protein ABT160_00895 [Streptomyces sp. NPDC001941]|uniref:hypothetical protein n=1 Tax=Streptomyces sp. NPDC001941 TaxID=3154659 RepID=UPI00331798F8